MEKITFASIIENCELTENQKVALAGLINAHWLPTAEGEDPTGPVEYCKINEEREDSPVYAVYATNRAKEKCALAPRALGAIFSGLGKRVNNIDEIMYCKDYLKAEGSKKQTGNNAILILKEFESEALVWAQQFPTDPYVETEEMKAEKLRKKAEKAAKNADKDAVAPSAPKPTKPIGGAVEIEEEEEEIVADKAYLSPSDYLASLG